MKLDSKELLEKLNWRYATKAFDRTKTIPAELVSTIEKALVATPSSYGLQPWKFIFITDKELRKKLTPFSWNQPQVEACSHFVVLAAKTQMDRQYVENYVKHIASVRGVDASSLEAYKQMMIQSIEGPLKEKILNWTSRQVYIALGQLMTCCALLEIDACPMEGFQPEKYDEILGLNKIGFSSVVCCALGYRSSEDIFSRAKKVRFEVDAVVERR